MDGKTNGINPSENIGKYVWKVYPAGEVQAIDYPSPELVSIYNGTTTNVTWEYGDSYYCKNGLFYINDPTTKTFNESNYNTGNEMVGKYAIALTGSSIRTQMWKLGLYSTDQYVTTATNSYGLWRAYFAKQDYYYQFKQTSYDVLGYVVSDDANKFPNGNTQGNYYYQKGTVY